jgi:predicted nucleic acid-binding protein
MEPEYLIDTNVIIDYMSERLPLRSLNALDKIFNGSFSISVINKIEILGFKHLAIAEEKQIHNLLDNSNIIFLHDGIVEETISLRKKYLIKLPDAIIAASVIFTNSTLLTRNFEDFNKIAGLKVLHSSKL